MFCSRCKPSGQNTAKNVQIYSTYLDRIALTVLASIPWYGIIARPGSHLCSSTTARRTVTIRTPRGPVSVNGNEQLYCCCICPIGVSTVTTIPSLICWIHVVNGHLSFTRIITKRIQHVHIKDVQSSKHLRICSFFIRNQKFHSSNCCRFSFANRHITLFYTVICDFTTCIGGSTYTI